MEEAAYIDARLFAKVIVPLLLMRYVCVFGISSPSEESNYLSFLKTVRSKTTGELIFLTISFGFDCAECEAEGRFPGKCNHPRYVSLPTHRDPKMLDYAETLLGADLQSISQELYGVSMSSHNYILREFMDEFRRRHDVDGPYVFKDPVQILHSYVDPSGGGDGSDFAVVTMARVRDQYIIVAMSRWHNDQTSHSHIAVNRMLKQHYQRIFDNPLYRNAKVWLYWEIQMGHIQADQYTAFIKGLHPGKIFPYHGVKGKPNQIGVPVNEDRKMAWSDAILEVMTCQSLWYASDFITSDIGDLTTEESVMLVKGEFEDQCHRETCDIKIPVDVFGRPKKVFGAKQGGKKDDILTAVKGTVYEMKQRLQDHAYSLFCAAHSIQRK
jgi:hypothetical protein